MAPADRRMPPLTHQWLLLILPSLDHYRIGESQGGGEELSPRWVGGASGVGVCDQCPGVQECSHAPVSRVEMAPFFCVLTDLP